MTTFYLAGKSLYIDGQLRQIADDDCVYCPRCHEPTLYWQLPFSPCYEGEDVVIAETSKKDLRDRMGVTA